MDSIDGIGLYPVLSFLIFFTVFILMLVYIIAVDKKTMKARSSMALNNNELKAFENENQ